MNNAHRPAYPTNLIWDNKGNMHKVDFLAEGLTKREKIAAMAMQGLLASGRYQGASEDALEFADALLNELEKGESCQES